MANNNNPPQTYHSEDVTRQQSPAMMFIRSEKALQKECVFGSYQQQEIHNHHHTWVPAGIELRHDEDDRGIEISLSFEKSMDKSMDLSLTRNVTEEDFDEDKAQSSSLSSSSPCSSVMNAGPLTPSSLDEDVRHPLRHVQGREDCVNPVSRILWKESTALTEEDEDDDDDDDDDECYGIRSDHRHAFPKTRVASSVFCVVSPDISSLPRRPSPSVIIARPLAVRPMLWA